MDHDIQEKKHKKPSQEYDNTLKALFGEEASAIVPNLLAGTRVESEKNIEIDRSILKADLAYFVEYDSGPAILNLELQTSTDKPIEPRLLQYHAGLHAKYSRPVISVVIYPFKTAVPKSPYTIRTANELCLVLHYKTICLWELDAEPFIKNHIYCMYTLLPAMKGANVDLLKQALKEMVQYYPRQQLGHRLIRFHRIMQRATIMTEQEKQIVEEELRMQYAYDEFIDDNPVVLERINKKVAEKIAEKVVETELKNTQNMILNLLNLRFPELSEQTSEKIRSLKDKQRLDTLFNHLVLAKDKQEARAAILTIQST